MTFFEEISKAGIPFSNHESDLYIPATQKAKDILKKYPLEWANSYYFINQAEPNKGELWIDIPFAYSPWWIAKSKIANQSK